MAGSIEKKLSGLGVTLPIPASPIANYVPFVRSGNMLVVSGQICFGTDGKLVAKGQLGGGVSIVDGQKAARAARSICWRNSNMRLEISIKCHVWYGWVGSSIQRPASPMDRK